MIFKITVLQYVAIWVILAFLWLNVALSDDEVGIIEVGESG